VKISPKYSANSRRMDNMLGAIVADSKVGNHFKGFTYYTSTLPGGGLDPSCYGYRKME